MTLWIEEKIKMIYQNENKSVASTICEPCPYDHECSDCIKNTAEIKKTNTLEKRIVITTMTELPELCYKCPCHDGEHGDCNADPEHRYNIEYRPFWCPLKEE